MRPPSDLPRRRTVGSAGRRGRNAALAFLAVLVVGLLTARGLARVVTDGWWFDSIGQRAVLSTINRARFELGVVGGLSAAVVLYVCLLLAGRTRPLDPAFGPDDQLVVRYQVLMAEHGLALRGSLAGLFGLVAGLPLAARWQEWLLFRNAVSFRSTDGVYQHDIGFYVFRLPFLGYLVEWVFTVLAVATLASAAAHYLSGAVRLSGPRRAAAGVRLHLSVLLVALALVRAVAYWLHRYQLVTSTRGYVRGLGYTDEHHVRPALLLLILVAVSTAVLLLVGVRQRSWHLPMVATALWAVVALMAGTVYPAVVQRVVSNDEPARRERPVIIRNLAATRTALGMDASSLTTEPVASEPMTVTSDDLAGLVGVRLLSSAGAARWMALPTATGARAPAVGTVPDAGLYLVGDRTEQVYVGVPAIDPGDKVSWVQRHRQDVAAPRPFLLEAGRVTTDGRGVVPTAQGALAVTDAPIYVGERVGSFAVVSASSTRPLAALAAVPLSSFARRAAFALRFADLDLVQRTQDTDRILFVRSVADRVRMLAPFLSWDSDPYAVVADGRVQWVIDGYTTTDAYPAGERADVAGLPAGSGLRHEFNYVRNSVKAVVDAHEGRIALYAVDEADPVLRAWRNAFPTLFDSWPALSGAVKAQLRYPSDLLRVQSTMWGRYRTDTERRDDAAVFTTLKGRWTAAPKRVVGAALTSAVTATTARNRATTTTTTGAAAGAAARATQTVEPAYAVWNGRIVAVAAMVAAERPATQEGLAALVTGTVGIDGRPLLRVVRTDAGVPSPGAARAAIEEAIRQFVPDIDEDTGLGELQPVVVGSTVAWVLPWYEAAGTALAGVAMLADGRVRVGTSVEGAAQALFGVDPGFHTVDGAELPPTSPTAPVVELTVDELLARAGAAYREATRKLDAGDPTNAIALFREAFQYADQAARKAQAAAPPPTTTPPTTAVPATTTSTGPTVNA